MFTIFNLPPPPDPSFFYDANYDSDIQHEIAVAPFGDPNVKFKADTVAVDMIASSPVNGDGKNVMNVTAQYFQQNPPANLIWQLVWVFQWRDLPFSSQVQVVIDYVRFCDGRLNACLVTGVPGDYNGNDQVDAADYVCGGKVRGCKTRSPIRARSALLITRSGVLALATRAARAAVFPRRTCQSPLQ